MSHFSRVGIALKAFFQLGPRLLALNALYRFGLRIGHFQRVEKRELENRRPVSAHYSLFSLPNREQLKNVLGRDGLQTLLAGADEIVGGKFRRFGGEAVPLQLTFDQPLRHWTEYELHPQLLSPLYSQVPDIKFIWEPARFGWAFTLGRAYTITQDEKYA
ncbi:MAG TPA: hypothetical protein VMT73_04065, partial [Anaerolineales bacterium]|nr:hypothetical protein [Anaerolineales bacterium]